MTAYTILGKWNVTVEGSEMITTRNGVVVDRETFVNSEIAHLAMGSVTEESLETDFFKHSVPQAERVYRALTVNELLRSEFTKARVERDDLRIALKNAATTIEEMKTKLQIALSHVPTETGSFRFPDGDCWPCADIPEKPEISEEWGGECECQLWSTPHQHSMEDSRIVRMIFRTPDGRLVVQGRTNP